MRQRRSWAIAALMRMEIVNLITLKLLTTVTTTAIPETKEQSLLVPKNKRKSKKTKKKKNKQREQITKP